MNARQQKFVERYLVHLNQTKAAEEAGYASAQVESVRLMKRPDVLAAIQKAIHERATRNEITADRVIQELAKVAFGDLRKVMSWDASGVQIRASSELADEDAAMVSEVCETRQGGEDGGSTIKVKTHDKVAALTLLGRHLGIFKDKLELSGNVELGSRLESARRRIKDGKA